MSTSPTSAAANLQTQAVDPKSALRSGALTKYTESLVVVTHGGRGEGEGGRGEGGGGGGGGGRGGGGGGGGALTAKAEPAVSLAPPLTPARRYIFSNVAFIIYICCC